jgi:anaerobic magnesium-protoporphyrin IX monomethyl ester cyclase
MAIETIASPQKSDTKKGVLFTHSYFLRFDPKQWKTGQPYAPLGTLYAASLLRENGYAVSLHDVQFAKDPDEILPVLQEKLPDYFIIYDDGFNYLTKMCLTNMREAAFKMIGYAKQKGCTVIVSSSDATDHFEKYLDAGADYVLIGEAEQSLLDLLHSFEEERDRMQIPGLAFMKDKAVIKTARRAVMRDLDQLPLPAWDLMDMEPYKAMWLRHAGYFSVNIGTTRGCPFKCNWCAKPIYGNRYNARSPQHVIRELKYIQSLFGFDHIWFCDDIFGLKPGWVNEFADLTEKEGMKFRFKIQSRADLLLQENYVTALARAGCENVWMGAESGSQKILDAMDKGITVEQIGQATRLLKKHGIKPSFFIQFGYLGETMEDIKKTIRMINELMPFEIGISVSYPLPGTGFYDKVKDQLKQKANWTDSDELALMFHNTYQAKFYKQLHRYVHRNYRKQVAVRTIYQLIRKPFSSNWTMIKKAVSGIYLVPAVYLAGWKLKQSANLS